MKGVVGLTEVLSHGYQGTTRICAALLLLTQHTKSSKWDCPCEVKNVTMRLEYRKIISYYDIAPLSGIE